MSRPRSLLLTLAALLILATTLPAHAAPVALISPLGWLSELVGTVVDSITADMALEPTSDTTTVWTEPRGTSGGGDIDNIGCFVEPGGVPVCDDSPDNP